MKRLILGVTAMMVLTLAGWSQNTPSERQSHANIEAHRKEARNNAERRHHRRRHHRHHRRHTGA
jgi:hypothetical protein